MSDIDKATSYGHANVLPVKLLRSPGARELRPVHVAWFPTNRCNLACKYCSCSKRELSLQMDMDVARGVIRNLHDLGCRAVSIAGGGEPLAHPDIARMIDEFHGYGIKVGMTTNGLLLHRVTHDTLSKLTWCRISHDDARILNDTYRRILEKATKADVDWAFSYVVGVQPNYSEIVKILEFADAHNFTHVRLIGDVRHPEAIDWDTVWMAVSGKDQKVVYQYRTDYVCSDSCLLGYVKPVIAPNWKMFLCCNVQFQTVSGGMPFDMLDQYCMGSALELDKIYGGDKKPFKVECDKCYYDQLNQGLKAITATVAHEEFL